MYIVSQTENSNIIVSDTTSFASGSNDAGSVSVFSGAAGSFTDNRNILNGIAGGNAINTSIGNTSGDNQSVNVRGGAAGGNSDGANAGNATSSSTGYAGGNSQVSVSDRVVGGSADRLEHRSHIGNNGGSANSTVALVDFSGPRGGQEVMRYPLCI